MGEKVIIGKLQIPNALRLKKRARPSSHDVMSLKKAKLM